MKRKKMLVLGLAVCAVCLLGCQRNKNTASGSGAANTAASGTAKPYLFGFTVPELTNPAMIALRDSLQKEIEARGGRLISSDSLNDQTRQNDVVEDMITSGIDLLFIAPVNSQGTTPTLEACREAGVKVIAVDINVDRPDLIESFVSSDNFQAGELCGKEIVRLFPDGAKICIFEAPTAESIVSRVNGLESAIKGTKSIIIDRQNISTMDKVLSTTEDFIQRHPDVNVFWGLNDPVGLVMLGALESAGLGDTVKVIAVDGSVAGKKSVAAGGLIGTAAQSFNAMGKQSVDLAYKVLSGEKIEKAYSIDTILITKDNIDQFPLESWQ